MGRRLKPCEFCEDEWVGEYVEDKNGYCLWAECYPFSNNLAVIAQANNEEGEMIEHAYEIQMNYCPVCGRKL